MRFIRTSEKELLNIESVLCFAVEPEEEGEQASLIAECKASAIVPGQTVTIEIKRYASIQEADKGLDNLYRLLDEAGLMIDF